MVSKLTHNSNTRMQPCSRLWNMCCCQETESPTHLVVTCIVGTCSKSWHGAKLPHTSMRLCWQKVWCQALLYASCRHVISQAARGPQLLMLWLDMLSSMSIIHIKAACWCCALLRLQLLLQMTLQCAGTLHRLPSWLTCICMMVSAMSGLYVCESVTPPPPGVIHTVPP